MYLLRYMHVYLQKFIYVYLLRCERHLKFFGREDSEMKTAKSFAIKIVLAQQKNMIIYPRAVVAAYLLQHRKCDIGNKIRK